MRTTCIPDMAESTTRFFRDQRYPDELISIEQLKREYDESTNPDELSFAQYLFNCMESQGGTLSEVSPESKGRMLQ